MQIIKHILLAIRKKHTDCLKFNLSALRPAHSNCNDFNSSYKHFLLKTFLALIRPIIQQNFHLFNVFQCISHISDSLEHSSAGRRTGFCAWWLRIAEEYKGPGSVKKTKKTKQQTRGTFAYPLYLRAVENMIQNIDHSLITYWHVLPHFI